MGHPRCDAARRAAASRALLAGPRPPARPAPRPVRRRRGLGRARARHAPPLLRGRPPGLRRVAGPDAPARQRLRRGRRRRPRGPRGLRLHARRPLARRRDRGRRGRAQRRRRCARPPRAGRLRSDRPRRLDDAPGVADLWQSPCRSRRQPADGHRRLHDLRRPRPAPSRDLMARLRRARSAVPGRARRDGRYRRLGPLGARLRPPPGRVRRAGRRGVGRPRRAVPAAHIAALRRPQAHIEVWDGMGHHPQRERPVALAGFIERHASRLPRGPR